ncbi:response regulator transcription factor [Rhodococcus sp. ABRD24]|uniref:response regulator n=1 Tax=Rhodococcus sp. ABRD24 TaxID=2507582 RepID=UPI0010401142|nr:response regulator transcription factor [Rhodococcus sp. ABRD24]QBJ97487.1 response regulator transcription factor [Rhodococcus sp. ABRD24]
MTRVFLVDDHEIVRRGLVDLLGSAPDLTVVGEAASVGEALARLPGSGADVAVLDVRLPDGNGVELCRDLRALLPELRCLMLTSYADDEALFDAVMAGASGFVLKQILGTDLVSAVRTVGAGGSLLDSRATAVLMQRIRSERDTDPLAELSEQERAVFDLIGQGLTNREIAQRLFLAEKTIKNYVSRLLAKLGMQRRTQAAVLATELRNGRRG